MYDFQIVPFLQTKRMDNHRTLLQLTLQGMNGWFARFERPDKFVAVHTQRLLINAHARQRQGAP